MKTGWDTKTLGDVCDFLRGLTYAKSDEVAVSSNIVLRATNIDLETNRLDLTELKYINDKVVVPGGKKVRKGSLLICTASGSKSHLGKIALIDDDYDFAFGGFMGMLTPRSELVPKFLFHLMTSGAYKDFIAALSDGANINNLKFSDLQRFVIPVPPLPEQQRIVAILDEAFEAIAAARANAEQNRQNARTLFESYLQSVFSQRGEGWVEKKLGDVCDFLNGYAFKSNDVISNSKTQLVRMGNLYGNQLDLDRNPVFYPDNFATNYKRFVLNAGDLIMSLTGTTGKEDYGFAVQIPETDSTLLMNQRIAKFDSINENLVDRNYLLHYLRSRVFLDVLYPTANGTRQANLSTVTMKALPIPLCSIVEQKEIAYSLDQLSSETKRLESLYQRKIDVLDELKQALLQQAFRGQLDTTRLEASQ